MDIRMPLNFKKWIDENRESFRPPVGNKVVWKNSEFIIMVVGGPNSRKDYHFNEGEEFFYQLEGDIVVKTIQDGKPVDVPIKQGEIYLLPARTPHSPRRGANTIGLVVERRRLPNEKDGFQWYCEECGNKLYEEFITLTDIVAQLPPIFERYWGDISKRTCSKCQTVMEPPQPAKT
ncbi:MAG: 3-hydroxyanthranilate 3,4-dioxygenase [Proteobacteria bacterium]|nr:MAG: 3-hydroxyanthranilate 3,4-dioxygenase [Pseudomonadota bacterium]